MWTSNELGLAVWSDGRSAWHFDVRGGEFGISLLAGESASTRSSSPKDRYVSLLPVGDATLPAASEQYVRGHRYFVNYPQGAGQYAVRLTLVPVATAEGLIVLEATTSIQTDLLDSHPMLDLVAEGDQLQSLDAESGGENWRASVANRTSGSAAITLVRSPTVSTAVLLGPHDQPFTRDLSGEGRLCLRLFGDFLEKGVIRTARPWIAVDLRGSETFPRQLVNWHQQLCDSPLPLSS